MIDENGRDKYLVARHKTFEGFGERLTLAEWSRRLGLNRASIWRYLKRGLTIEDIAKLRGLLKDETP